MDTKRKEMLILREQTEYKITRGVQKNEPQRYATCKDEKRTCCRVLREKRSIQRSGAVQTSVMSTSCSCKQTAIKAVRKETFHMPSSPKNETCISPMQKLHTTLHNIQ